MKDKKLLCYVIIVSEYFPSKHKRAGDPTFFEKSIDLGSKLHTIRKNYTLWEKRFEKVNSGKAYLSLRKWEGRPRQSQQIEFKRLYNTDGIGIEKLTVIKNKFLIEDKLSGISLETLASHDGLSVSDFIDWFGDIEPGEELGIIHFTKARYI